MAISESYKSLFEENRELLNDGSSPLLNRMRDIAISRFAKAGVPDVKNEDYKYTSLKPAFSKIYKHYFSYREQEVDLHDVFKCDVPYLDTHLVLLVNGWYYIRNQKIGNLPTGVIVGSLQQIAYEKPELLQNYLNRQAALSEDATVALNTAFAKDGLFIYIPKNVVVEKPIQVVNLMRGNGNAFVTQRNLIIAEENSQVKLVMCDHTLSSNEFLCNTVSEVFVGEHAVLDYYTVQNQHNNTKTINSTFFRQEANSNLLTHTATLHGGLVRNNLKVTFNGEHAEANILGMSFTDKNQHVDNYTIIEHAKPNCLSNQLYKNVLDENSTGAFAGRIHVARDAQKTNAFQRNNNVLLTDSARMQTKPQLIIDADDVKCSHGATIGQIDREALFFLRSRGIGEADARLMLMNAFTYEVVQNIRVEPLRDRISELVDKRLRGDLAKCHSCNYECNS
ncbi:MAG: Fe-S cluster assembly protein SufD [Bacteroidetes bacterium GWF2_42_66]|nr:MAG: Fe-S cluster assembly protein SufD [Bacteroidetes bacterium GWA2_42_15]OFX99755.1 MAG: Fe-S cluster assembly protein SufD [Bacteroidetes bacterium GWE2_42_39]OFY39793.1 MAG: Fe-S cluster assembly protein SufD [Bacteroidetes bacterium GWF2_42_66]